jgi:isopenicillin N synthase-like dioxygenase
MHTSLRRIIVICYLILFCNVCQATLDPTIPVVDLNDFHSVDRHHIFVRDLANAFKTVGFVAVVNSGVDINTLDTAYDAAKKFYASPIEFKMLGHAAHLSGQRGYVLSETAKGNKKKDYKEFYHITREYSAEVRARYNYVENIWPSNDGFKPAMQNLIVALDKHVAIIEQAISESIGEKPDFISNMTQNGDYLLRSIYYPPNPPADSIWAAAHTDIDLFTILPRSTASGLQLQRSDGSWINVVVPDNAFIINAGDMLQNLTNGVYKSAVHRVVSQEQGVERYSIVAFIHPRPTDQLGPLAKFIKEVGKRKFADATQKELLSERLVDLGLNSPAMLEQLAKSGLMDRLIDVNRASPTAMRALRDAKLASPKVLAALRHLDKQG